MFDLILLFVYIVFISLPTVFVGIIGWVIGSSLETGSSLDKEGGTPSKRGLLIGLIVGLIGSCILINI